MLPSFGRVFLVADTMLWYKEGNLLVSSNQTADLVLETTKGGASLPNSERATRESQSL